MCAPGSKHWVYAHLKMYAAIVAATFFLLREVEHQAIFEQTFLEPLSGPAKWYYTEEVLQEQNALVHYAEALARADMVDGSHIFLLTALDYNESNTNVAHLQAVWSSYDAFVYGTMCPQVLPFSWDPHEVFTRLLAGETVQRASGRLVLRQPAQLAAGLPTLQAHGITEGSTLWLTATLAGGAPKKQRSGFETGGGTGKHGETMVAVPDTAAAVNSSSSLSEKPLEAEGDNLGSFLQPLSATGPLQQCDDVVPAASLDSSAVQPPDSTPISHPPTTEAWAPELGGRILVFARPFLT